MPRPDASTRFRRRSINKYIPSPPPEEEAASGATTPAAAAPRASPFGSSVPMAITPRLSSLRSPPASTSPAPAPVAFHVDTTAEELAASPPTSRNSTEVDSYLRTARFPSAGSNGGLMSPYLTRLAQEVAAQAMVEGEDNIDSVVGGVDGRTGLDPESFSVRGRNSFASPGMAGGGAFSLSRRMADEDEGRVSSWMGR